MRRMSSVADFRYRRIISEVTSIISRAALGTPVRMGRFNPGKISSIYLINLHAIW
jgi:hypothetical protein